MNIPTQSAPAPEKTLRQLFLTLFLRGRTSRGLQKSRAPKSVGQRLGLSIFWHVLFGCMALGFIKQPVFAMSVYLHAFTFVFLGMFVASSAGEVLFNNEEADILLHRPITPKALLWAKVFVLVQVSLWLAGALNLVGLFVGYFAPDGGWRFPLVHAMSTCLEAMFCTGCVVMVYQLCLRWFGRERLNGLMTTAQVLISIAAVVGGQLVPRLMFYMDHVVKFSEKSWWIILLPPAWFSGLDDALAGSGAAGAWVLAATAVILTTAVLLISFGKLARDYGTGLQRLAEMAPRQSPGRNSRRWLDRLIDMPPLRWWTRNQVERASFLLVAAYLVRDRDVKLRIYPAMAPILVLPFVFLMQNHNHNSGGIGAFGIAMAGGYLGLVPLMALTILQYSQQWQAADIFRVAPMLGPAALFHGARRAVLCLLTLPLVLMFALIVWLVDRNTSELLLLIPGAIALPVYALTPGLAGKAVPLSLPTEEAKSTRRGLTMIVVVMISLGFSGIVSWSWSGGWFWWLVMIEAIIASGIYLLMRRSMANVRWPSLE